MKHLLDRLDEKDSSQNKLASTILTSIVSIVIELENISGVFEELYKYLKTQLASCPIWSYFDNTIHSIFRCLDAIIFIVCIYIAIKWFLDKLEIKLYPKNFKDKRRYYNKTLHQVIIPTWIELRTSEKDVNAKLENLLQQSSFDDIGNTVESHYDLLAMNAKKHHEIISFINSKGYFEYVSLFDRLLKKGNGEFLKEIDVFSVYIVFAQSLTSIQQLFQNIQKISSIVDNGQSALDYNMKVFKTQYENIINDYNTINNRIQKIVGVLLK